MCPVQSTGRKQIDGMTVLDWACLGQQIRERRLCVLKKTLRQLAVMIKTSPGYLSTIETGVVAPSPTKLAKIAKCLGWSPEEMLLGMPAGLVEAVTEAGK